MKIFVVEGDSKLPVLLPPPLCAKVTGEHHHAHLRGPKVQTKDFLDAKQVFYQLSYTSSPKGRNIFHGITLTKAERYTLEFFSIAFVF